MLSFLPPDRDPELRRAFALDADAQCAELRRMLNGDNPPPLPAAPLFQPVGVTLKRTARGALVCVPIKFPPEAWLDADDARLCICVTHRMFDSWSAPRTAAAIEELQRQLDAHLPNRGIVLAPFARPAAWTVQTVWQVIQRLVAELERRAGPAPRGYFVQKWTEPHAADFRMELRAYDHSYTATVYLCGTAVAAARAIDTLVGRGQRVSDLARVAAQWQAQPAGAQDDEGPDEFQDDADDDDDLDPIERAAKRALGGKFRRDREPPASLCRLPLREKLKRLSLPSRYLIERVATLCLLSSAGAECDCGEHRRGGR